MKLILASGSPRRRDMLTEYGYKFEVIAPSVDETMNLEKTPYENVKEVSLKKAMAVYNLHSDCATLACDTIVTLDGKIYGKPHSHKEAYDMIKTFSGKTHEVVSGVALVCDGVTYNFYTVSEVTFKSLTEDEINSYIDTDEPYDKAGSYAIQGIGSRLVKEYKGSLNNIIGLPIEDLKEYLDKVLGD